MSDHEVEVVLSPEGEQIARHFGGILETLNRRLGEVEARVGQIERLLSLRLGTKLMAVPGGDNRDAAELLEGIREGVQIETILLDVGQRLYDLEYALFAPKQETPEEGDADVDTGADAPAEAEDVQDSGVQ